MKLRALPLFLLLSACSAMRTAPAKPDAAPGEHYIYRAQLAGVPPGAGKVRLSVRVPNAGPAGELSALSAFGLVGNAPFEVEVPATSSGEVVHGQVTVRWSPAYEDKRCVARTVEVETDGKPIELGLGLALATPAAAAPDGVQALEAELKSRTSAEIDGRAVNALATHLERTGGAPR